MITFDKRRFVSGLAFGLAAVLAVGEAAAGEMFIDLTYDSTMDMVRPQVHPGISVHHNLHVTLSGGKLVENRDRSTGRYIDKRSTVQEHGSSEGGAVSWHVVDEHHLVRVQSFSQSVRKMTVSVESDNSCRLEVSDQLKPGFNEYAFMRISTHEMGYFSSYQVASTTCTIR